jgi:hypothetical protein
LEGNQWVASDARAFNDWFHDKLQATEQMRSCIKYLKAWKDFLSSDLKGIHITVLAGLNHAPVKDRDDESLAQTVENMRDYLEGRQAIWNPVDPEENFLEGWSTAKVSQTIKHLDWFCEKAASALKSGDEGLAAQEWRALFGARFPVIGKGGKEEAAPAKRGETVIIASAPFRDPPPRQKDRGYA